MGKKDKKKGKGAEKTAVKTEKKLNSKLKKELALKGEEDIESLLAKFAAEDHKKCTITEDLVKSLSRRSSFSLTPHPDKDQLILFGGEYFNGNKTFLYNDLFFYHIKQDRWIKVTSPGAPPPRSSHQAVALSQGGGQLWIFGGEFTSESQSQFYHYKDLWVYHFSSMKWEKVVTHGTGPSSRSGHRMVALKKQLFVFGGFHDTREYKYYNDVHIFNLENYTWNKITPVGNCPSPRSACHMLTTPEGRILIYGGYSKEKLKKDVDKGVTHCDMFLLAPDKHDSTGLKWKWQTVKQAGLKPSIRCAFSMTSCPPDKALLFGGVFDEEDHDDDEEQLCGSFYNDLYQLDLSKPMWHEVTLSGKADDSNIEKKKRRKNKDGVEPMECEQINDQLDDLCVTEEQPVVTTDGIFTVTVGPSLEAGAARSVADLLRPSKNIFLPPPRINGGLVVKKNILYLYGGIFEDGDRQLTLNDFYSLDLNKLTEWQTIIPLNVKDLEWFDSDSDEDDDSDSDEEEESDDDMET